MSADTTGDANGRAFDPEYDPSNPYRVNRGGIDPGMKRRLGYLWMIQGDKGKVPMQPDAPEQYAKSNDSATWGNFDDALDVAEEHPERGVGYLLAQPGQPYTALDIDIPDGGAWVPDLRRLDGSTAEYSPTGNLRVYLSGVETPAWWTNLSGDGANTRELKVFSDSGYVTVTGDLLPGFDAEITDTDQDAFEAFLRDAWWTFNPEADESDAPWNDDAQDAATAAGERSTTGRTPTGSRGDDVDLDVTDVAPAGTPVGERVAHPIHGSDTGTNFKIDDDRETFRCWRHDVTGNALHYLGMDAGIIECGEWDDGGLSSETWREIFDYAREEGYDVPDPAGDPGPEADDLAERIGYDGDGTLVTTTYCGPQGYEKLAGSGDDAAVEETTSFLLAAKHRLITPDGEERYGFTVIPREGDPYNVDVPLSVFNDPRTFKENVCTRGGAYLAASYSFLNTLREAVVKTDVPTRGGVKKIGLFGAGEAVYAEGDTPEYVFPGGTLRADGWTDEPDYVFSHELTTPTRNATLSPDDRPAGDYDPEAVAEALNLIPRTRDPERFIPVLGWFYASLFRPVIKTEAGDFPHLDVTGETEAGKSATLETLWDLFGMGNTPLELSDETKFTMTAHIGATNAVPLFYDEYKPSEIQNVVLDTFHGHYRKSTRGGTASRGRPDGSTETYRLDAPLAVAGESAVTGPAEQRRSVMTTFRRASAKGGTPTAKAFDRLEGLDARDHAYALYRWVLGRLEDGDDEILADWTEAGDDLDSALGSMGYDTITGTERKGLQTVVFGVRMFRAFATDMGLEDDSTGLKAVSNTEVLSALRVLADDLTNGERRERHLDAFLGLLSNAATEGYLEDGVHYTVVNNDKPTAEVRVNLHRAYPRVKKYLRDHGMSDDVDVLGEGDYRGRFEEAADETTADSYVTVYAKRSPPISKGHGIHVSTAVEVVADFDPSAFGVTGPSYDGGAEVAERKAEEGREADDDRVTVLNILKERCADAALGTIQRDELVVAAARRDGIDFDRADHLIDALLDQGKIVPTTHEGKSHLEPSN